MAALDDPDSKRDDVRVAVWCTKAQTVIATASLRDKRLGDAAVDVAAGAPAVIGLPVPVGSQGAARVTIFTEDLKPMAERLIYRGRGTDLKVALKGDRPTYAPRDQVELTVETRDLAGKPVAADLSLAVVDDTVLSFADDKTAHLLARLYLESEMPGQEIEEPNFYFSDKPKASRALDLVLGTQGWRRFAWEAVLAPPEPEPESVDYAYEDDMVPQAAPMDEAKMAPQAARPMRAPVAKKPKAGRRRGPGMRQQAPKGMPMGKIAGNKRRDRAAGAMGRRGRRAERKMMMREAAPGWAGGGLAAGEAEEVLDDDWDGVAKDKNVWAWAPVRQFPAPTYKGRYDGPRVDFRETIYWQPSVKTDKRGTAKVRFYLSDGVTSFRATAEGVSAGGLPGRGEALVQSKLPVSLAVTMPLEVSAGDSIRLPVTLSNETDREYPVSIATQFGSAGSASRSLSVWTWSATVTTWTTARRSSRSTHPTSRMR
jgi:hypothetical protein